jgi:hypothetical protein
MKRKIGSFYHTVVSDSDSDGEDSLPRPREEDLYHRAMRMNENGRTHLVVERVTVPASPLKRHAERNMLQHDDNASVADDWASTVDLPFPFAGEDSFAFDEGHPVDPGRRKERDSVGD